MQYQRVPLNVDAFNKTAHFKTTAHRTEDQEEIIRASQNSIAVPQLITDLNNIDEDPLSSEALKSLIHRRGICVRHLGIICSQVSLKHTREIILIEVASRCARIVF